MLALLGACSTLEGLLPSSPGTAATEDQATPAKADTVTETAPLAPVALAAGLGTSPQPEPNPQPITEPPAKPAAAAPVAPPAAAKPTSAVASAAPAEPAIDGVAVAPPSVNCPSGTIGMWSQRDVTGTAVYICRALHPPR